MVQHEIIRVDATKMLKNVSAQPYYRGDLIFAEDARGQYLIVSQSISGIALALDKVCNQTVSVTSLYESARRELCNAGANGAHDERTLRILFLSLFTPLARRPIILSVHRRRSAGEALDESSNCEFFSLGSHIKLVDNSVILIILII
jgi:hypothetical protein